MDRKPNKPFDSWNIPKKTSAPMNMTIPKKSKPQGGTSGESSSLTGSIPRKNSFSRPMHASIPRKPSSFQERKYSDSASIPRKSSFQGDIPRKSKQSFSEASIPRKHSMSDISRKQQHSASSMESIPRKKSSKAQRLPLSKRPSRDPTMMTISEYPFVMKISLKGIPMSSGLPMRKTAMRDQKRKQISYQELQDTDEDDFLTDSDDETRSNKSSSKKVRKKAFAKASVIPVASMVKPSPAMSGGPRVDNNVSDKAFLDLNTLSVDVPPPGTLSTLWYSRECFMSILIVDKILAWKTRAVSNLEWVPESFDPENPPPVRPAIDNAAAKWSTMALTNPLIWSDPNKRMEVSRLVPAQCPVVMTMACKSQDDSSATTDQGETEKKPRYRIKALEENDREEVFLVKWRGRSHLHASWERGSDIIKYDQSKNTARHKIRRFVQSQEIMFGKQWQQVLEEERSTTATIHAHGDQTAAKPDADAVEEDYYPPACIEVERILACDESEMDMSLFAKQRALNIKDEQELVKQKESGVIKKWNSKEGLDDLLKEVPWDPEDNVRYVVKWKSLPFAEITWEYWRDIKKDAIDEAEEFWMRQQPPAPEVIAKNNRPHPHVRDFRKIQESPVFGLSKREKAGSELGQEREDEEDDTINQGLRLRSYQLEGVNWLLFNWWNKRSCILADEMGLGKTIQSLCFLKSLQDNPNTGVRGPFLIVAPLSLIGQWQSEARTWAPDLNVVLYHGSADARDFLVKQDFYYTDQFVPKATAIKLKKQHITKFHILITTYEVAMKDISIISKIRWRALIVDEAHRLKNPKSRLFSELAAVPRDYCLLLTGTPMANATEELWALLHFANQSAFDSKDDFLEKFGQLTDAEQVNELHSILKPYLLRRVKEDVEKSLPPKEETVLEVSLTPVQKKYYKAIYERNTTFLFKGSKPSNAPSLMNVMMELRKCCNHPYLVRGAEERILADAAQQNKNPDTTEAPENWTKLFEEQLIKSSGKMVLLDKLLRKLFVNGHKVLIFSQMVRVLDLLEEFLKIKRYKYERLDGSTSSSSRASAVDRFIRKSCQRFVMLLSTRAGGLGLNLTAADVVIIFDSDWNPQNDLQAMARAHRIGQTRAVRVYRLLTAKTYEMHMFHSASMKLGLERAVLSKQRDQGEDEDGEKAKSKSKSEREAQAKAIDSLLKKGAYDVFRDDDDDDAKKFMETDIDQLLERSSTTVTYGPNKSKSGLGSFSKASFVADTGDGEKDVDLDDPDFWQKAVGLEKPVETPEEIAQMLDDGVKRSRKQVQQFDPYAEFAELEQRKEDKIAQKKKEEKEEKYRIRKEKKQKKIEDKERRKRDREDARGAVAPTVKVVEELVPKKPPKEPKAKKVKKMADKKRTSKRAQNENPDFWIRQGWDVPQRNRAVASCLRFGFARFSRIRNESNLTSLPIQDFEVFFRSYFYQLSLQAAVSFLRKLKEENAFFTEENLKAFLVECLGMTSTKEIDWLCDCLSNGMRYYMEVESQARFLRLPRALAEPVFVGDLRRGPALRSLRRIFLLCRVQRIVEDCLDEILAQLGYEQLAKRGCQTSNVGTMDSDLKARLVSTEELTLSLNTYLKKVNHTLPVAWWDRSCDIGLLIGTFVHGLGNYEAMLNDSSLPFDFRMNQFARSDEACIDAQRVFDDATAAARKVFDDALVAFDLKEQQKNLAIISAAAANQTAREKDALALREGGAAADAVHRSMPTPVANNRYEIVDGDDSHYITLPRLQEKLWLSIRKEKSTPPDEVNGPISMSVDSKEGNAAQQETSGRRKPLTHHLLTMPDARVLDCRLGLLLGEIERNLSPEDAMDVDVKVRFPSIWARSKVVETNCKVRDNALSSVSGVNLEDLGSHFLGEYIGIGINGSQCAASHRSLDDATEFSIGAASTDLSHVGCASSRYVRAIGVPMNLTRFAISALIYADENCVQHFLEFERLRNYNDYVDGEEEQLQPKKQCSMDANIKAENEVTPPKAEANTESEHEKLIDTKRTESEDGSGKPISDIENLSQPGNGQQSEKDATSGAEEKIEETSKVPKEFEEDATLRASVCVVILHYGFPFADDRVAKPLWASIMEHCGHFDDSNPEQLFNFERFVSLVKEFGGDVEVPDVGTIAKYVETCLLPQCLRLCVMGNGPALTEARGSNGEYETAYGTSLYPEHPENLQSPLPDPCLDLSEHSIEALGTAHAILRRFRIMRTVTCIASGKASMKKVDEILHSAFMRKSMEGLPIWWCPWIHDAALLIHASTQGLFSILKDRKSENKTSAFSRKNILQHMYSTFVAENGLPRYIVDESPPEDSTSWIELQADDFPSANVLERRLAFLCAQASKDLDQKEFYANLPMFDHGSWPRN